MKLHYNDQNVPCSFQHVCMLDLDAAVCWFICSGLPKGTIEQWFLEPGVKGFGHLLITLLCTRAADFALAQSADLIGSLL